MKDFAATAARAVARHGAAEMDWARRSAWAGPRRPSPLRPRPARTPSGPYPGSTERCARRRRPGGPPGRRRKQPAPSRPRPARGPRAGAGNGPGDPLGVGDQPFRPIGVTDGHGLGEGRQRRRLSVRGRDGLGNLFAAVGVDDGQRSGDGGQRGRLPVGVGDRLGGAFGVGDQPPGALRVGRGQRPGHAGQRGCLPGHVGDRLGDGFCGIGVADRQRAGDRRPAPRPARRGR